MGVIGLNQGTETFVAVDTVGTVQYQTVKLDMGAAGATSPFTGTISEVTKISGGTLKVDGRVARNILSYGTTFGGAVAGYGTIVAAASIGAGTSLWVNDLSIINSKGAGTLTALVGFGTALNGSSVLVKGDFGPQGGIQKSYSLPVNAGSTNQDLVCYIGAAGTIDVNVSYFISA